MTAPVPPWVNVLVRYCPACRLVFSKDKERCPSCGRELVDQMRREPVETE